MINRRHFLQHAGGLASVSAASTAFGQKIIESRKDLAKNEKGAILIWLNGGPPTIDMWDVKFGAPTGGPTRPISTTGDFQINELMPELAKQGKDFSIVRSMATREADHMRGRYYMHTGFKPNPNMKHPSMGSVISYELSQDRDYLEIPPFFSISTGSIGGGFLGSAWNPFVVSSNGQVRNLGDSVDNERMQALAAIETGFVKRSNSDMAKSHMKMLQQTFRLNTSPQMKALKPIGEPKDVVDAYGETGFGKGALMARRLLQTGVPFVELGFGGWDLHQNTHETLSTKLPELDKVVSTLMLDLKRLDMWDNTAIVMMGEFGRTPKINQNAGRDHWARCWSAFVSGGLIKGGQAIGSTSSDGKEITSDLIYSSEDLMITICKSLGISTEKNYTAKNGRPMKIANGGKIIEGLV
jgi:uncharacterized protein (DUF1501 family)